MSAPALASARTFGDILAARAESAADRLAFAYSRDGVSDGETVTYGELHRRSQAVAARLLEAVEPGSRALLLLAPGLGYVAAVFGCFQAGVVGVSAAPPHPKRLNRTLPRLLAIADDAEVAAVLTTAEVRAAALPMLADGPLARATWIAVDDAPDGAAPGVVPRAESDLAFMQYTSGSTSDPRGVMLTHGNLLANSEFIARAFGHSPESRGFIWLPPYHDMGLIGGVLQPVFVGFPTALMSPTQVIKRPARWLEGISRFRATTSGGPNFAYDLVVRRVPPEARAGLDLSSWRVAFNGAEPIRAETIESFSAAFEGCGFRRSAFFPCYGLAEATLMVTGVERDAEPVLVALDARALEAGAARPPADGARAVRLVGCGRPDTGHDVAIVDPASGERLAGDRVGEIWVAGPSVAGGYWRRERETRELFGARIAGERDGREWLRTGDLGVVRDGELLVTGRVKDLIVISGRNHHPHDVEEVAEAADPRLRPHCSAAFALESVADAEAEAAGIVLEVDAGRDERLDEVVEAVRRRVAAELELQLHRIALCRPGSVPKTTSGKIQRRLCRQLLADGELELVADWRPES